MFSCTSTCACLDPTDMLLLAWVLSAPPQILVLLPTSLGLTFVGERTAWSTLVAGRGRCAALLQLSMYRWHDNSFLELDKTRRYPEIKHFVVQDLPETQAAAESFIASKGLSHKVVFEAQDFFAPQQRKGKYVFVMQRGVSNIYNHSNAVYQLYY